MKAIDHTDIHLEYLDARDEVTQVMKYGIRTVPAFVLVDDDGSFKQRSGWMSPEEYEAWLE